MAQHAGRPTATPRTQRARGALSTRRHDERVLAALAIMRKLPAGKERDAALDPLKTSGELTEAACADAGMADGSDRGGVYRQPA